MRKVGGRIAIGIAILALFFVSSCQRDSADADPAPPPDASVALRPDVVTAVRWFADRPIDEADGRGGTCRCGEPDALVNKAPDDPQAECVAVCLGTRGLLIAQMTGMFSDGPDADLFIYEWGTYHGGTDDPFSVLVSENGRDWILVAEAVCNDPGRPYASIDLGGRRGHYLFVKVLPAAERAAYAEGPEILAIEALHPSLDLGS